ncbi:MAG: response regulator [Woeseiaceae bacterium]
MKQDNFVVHVVDPDSAIADGLSTLFDTYGITVLSYPDAESFLGAMPPPCFGHCCLLIEANLPGISGPALLQKLRDERADLPLLLMISTSYPQLTEILQSSRQIGFIEKPCSNGMLVNKVLELREQA